MLDDLKIAIVCDWLTVFAGAERVVYELSRLFPKATIYTSLFDDKNCAAFKDRNVVESWLRYMPFARRFHRLYLPFMPLVFERIDLSEYDIVISSSHSASKGIITKPELYIFLIVIHRCDMFGINLILIRKTSDLFAFEIFVFTNSASYSAVG